MRSRQGASQHTAPCATAPQEQRALKLARASVTHDFRDFGS